MMDKKGCVDRSKFFYLYCAVQNARTKRRVCQNDKKKKGEGVDDIESSSSRVDRARHM